MSLQGRNFYCRVERDSIAPNSKRLTTFVITFPRIILAELRTMRVLSKWGYVEIDDDAGASFSMNSASSRAIPTNKLLQAVIDHPFVPEEVYKNQSGMQGSELLDVADLLSFQAWWRKQGRITVGLVREQMEKYNIHKQTVNRLLEPWLWTTIVCSGTEWSNFFALRTDAAAQPEFRTIARMMYDAYCESTPQLLHPGNWHLPFTDQYTDAEIENYMIENGYDPDCPIGQWLGEIQVLKRQVSAGRCAAVSYDNLENNERQAIPEVLARYAKLMGGDLKHSSPCEHQGTPVEDPEHISGNFRGWDQLRKYISNETILNFNGYRD